MEVPVQNPTPDAASSAPAPSALPADSDVSMPQAGGKRSAEEALSHPAETTEQGAGSSTDQLGVVDPASLSFRERREIFEPMSSRRRLIGASCVCAQSTPDVEPSGEVPVCYVATPDIGQQNVHDHRIGEVLDPELVRAGRAQERLNMEKRELYTRVRIQDSRGKKVRSMWLDEKRVATDQVRALSSAEAELYGIGDGAARGMMTRNLMSEIGVAWTVKVG